MTYAATMPRIQARVKTGGRWFMDHVWHDCLYYVRRSNAWPHATEEEETSGWSSG